MANVKDIHWFKKQKDQVYHRPGMWIGSCSPETSEEWVYNQDDKDMEVKNVTYVPGLLKIFNEVIDNARDASIKDKNVTQIKVTIDKESGIISVWNNGNGIEIKEHPEFKMLGPEIIFGKLNSGTNYDDSVERLGGGLNGLGVKLTNIFSTIFKVECADGTKKFVQVYKDNMNKRTNPKVTSSKVKPYVKISFQPDWKRFGLQEEMMTDDIYKMFMTSVVHTTATTDKRVIVYLNGKSVGVKNFEKFMDLYIGSNKTNDPRVFYSDPNGRWQVGLSISNSFQQVSFVNGIHTKEGGTHVKYVVNQVIKGVKEALSKKRDTKNVKINNSYIEQNIFIFVNAIIDKPKFQSQTKDSLKTSSSDFGSSCHLSDKFINNFIKKTDIVSRVSGIVNIKELNALNKTSGKKNAKVFMQKLDDANWAGTSKASDTTLFLTEGDSAKAFALCGFSEIGRDRNGVFPLRGKLINVRDASTNAIANNKEIQSLIKILGLKYGEKYENGTSSLRYGRICILTDADVDGSHIKGLIMNFIDHFWPNLFKHKFVWTFCTPIVKATKGKTIKEFHTLPEFEKWNKRNNGGWFIKYYKGLATFTEEEAVEQFKNLESKLTVYAPDKTGREFIDLAFRKKKANLRKDWLKNYDKETQIILKIPSEMGLSDFVHKDLSGFSMEDNIRSIPSIVDGLKPSQRKIIWFALTRSGFTNPKKELKVNSYAGALIAEMAYHHGEESASETIIKLGQTYIGSSNNINLLMPSGQFGTRILGGKDHGKSRYISTYLNPISRVIFDSNDDDILNLLEDDGKKVEPEHLMPILPMVLVNGQEGIGTGFSSSIPSYNPDDIKANLVRLMNGKEMIEMKPWYRGFEGIIRKKGDNFESVGIYKKLSDRKILVNELPIGVWTENYKEFLYKLKSENILTDIVEGSTNKKVKFIITFSKNAEIPDNDDDMKKYLKLVHGGLNISNMYLFNVEGKLHKYTSPLDIIQEFYNIRLDFYEKRKKNIIKIFKRNMTILSEKSRFIKLVTENKIIISKRKKSNVIQQLKDYDFKTIDDKYDYLLNLQLYLLTEEKIKELDNQYDCKMDELKEIEKTPIKVMWAKNLGELKI